MRKVVVLGNCLAERLALLLEPVIARRNKEKAPHAQWELVKVPPVYNLPIAGYTLESVSELALQCDVIFTQPLFNFGALNTNELQKRAAIRTHTFSAPNFEAYFPDVIHPGSFASIEKFPPPMDWHSRIFLEFKAAGVKGSEIEKLYFNHPLFSKTSIAQKLEKSWALYERRDQNVEIGTLELARKYYASEILFYTWKHPADRIIKHIVAGMLERLEFDKTEIEAALNWLPFEESPDKPQIWSYWGFGFNAWPVINRNTKLYSFPSRDFFRIHGKQLDILTAASLWFQYYDAHPDIFSELIKKNFS